MAAPSTQSPPLGFSSDTLALLQDSLHPNYTQVQPALANPYADYAQGVTVGDSLNAAVLSGLHAQQAQQSIAASQAAAQLAAAKSPYEIALLQANAEGAKAKAEMLPFDKKYNIASQEANTEEALAKRDFLRSKRDSYNSPAPVIEPFSPPSVAPATSATPSASTTLPDFSPGSLSAPAFNLDSTSSTDETPTPLLGSVTPAVDTSLATTLPTFDSTPPIDTSDLVAVSGAENPATATEYRNGAKTNTFTAKATGYHPVSSDSPDYKMEGGNQDALGQPIHTLDAFRRGEVPDVTVAVDRSSPLFGQSGFSPDLNAPVKFTDTGSAFKGKGTSRVDVARDNASGANSDENNGDLTFQVGNDVANGPLVQVSGAENPSTATVYQNGQSNAAAGVKVPKSQDELETQRNYANGWIARQTALLQQTNNPRQQQAIKAEIAGVNNALNRSEQIYLSSARKGTVTPTGNPADSLQDIDGYQKTDIRSTGGKLGARYVSNAQAASEQRAQGIKDINDAQELIGKQTGGATLNEFLNATPNQDGSFTVTHLDNAGGIDVPIQRTLPAPFYNQLANIARPAVFGDPKPVVRGSDTDAKIAALATDPEFGGRTDNVLPTTSAPLNLVLGRQVMSATPRPTYAPTAIPSVQSRLQQATTSLPASNDPLEQLGTDLAPGSPVRLPGEQAIALGNQEVTDTRNSKAAIMQRQIDAAKSDYARQRATTQDVAEGLDPYSGGAPYSAAAKGQSAATLREARAKLLAAQDPDNYVLGDNGAYVYRDPFRTNSSIDGQTVTVGGVTTTRRVTQ